MVIQTPKPPCLGRNYGSLLFWLCAFVRHGSASATLCLQTVGGDELNVCVATARLNGSTAPKPIVCVGLDFMHFQPFPRAALNNSAWMEIERPSFSELIAFAAALQWVSVLPEGIMGDVVWDCAQAAGVDLTLTKRVPNAELGEWIFS